MLNPKKRKPNYQSQLRWQFSSRLINKSKVPKFSKKNKEKVKDITWWILGRVGAKLLISSFMWLDWSVYSYKQIKIQLVRKMKRILVISYQRNPNNSIQLKIVELKKYIQQKQKKFVDQRDVLRRKTKWHNLVIEFIWCDKKRKKEIWLACI